MLNKAVFLDRDGTIIHQPVYENGEGYAPHKSEDFKLIDKSPEAIKILNDLNYKIIVITNQSGIGRGEYTVEDFNLINKLMIDQLAECGTKIDDVYYCPHIEEDNCDCKKPKTGMIKKAIKDHNIDIKKSWLIGDQKTDMEAGSEAEIKSILVKTGFGKRDLEKYNDIECDHIAKDLYDAVEDVILAN